MDKFPEVSDFEQDAVAPSGDLASREKALLGEEGAAELLGSGEPATAEPSDGEAYPDSGADDGVTSLATSQGASTAPSDDDSLTPSAPRRGGPEAYVPNKVDLAESEFLKDWKVKRDLEIERRDKVSIDKREETRERARSSIDAFYENYNAKREESANKVHEEADAFLKKRDEDIAGGSQTTWDRIAQLIDGTGRPADGVKPADKHRFKELVESLKGDRNAPGAAGY